MNTLITTPEASPSLASTLKPRRTKINRHRRHLSRAARSRMNLNIEQQRKHRESTRRRLIFHKQSVLSAYAAKVRKILDVRGTHKFIHPHTPVEYVLN